MEEDLNMFTVMGVLFIILGALWIIFGVKELLNGCEDGAIAAFGLLPILGGLGFLGVFF